MRNWERETGNPRWSVSIIQVGSIAVVHEQPVAWGSQRT